MSIPPFHWWRTVFFLIPAISIYTIVLGTLSILSTFVDSKGHAAHWCARAWSWLILATTGVDVSVTGLERVKPGETYIFISNHQSIYDIPVIFASLPFQLRIIAKESLGRFPFLGWHLVPRRSPARRSQQSRSVGHPETVAPPRQRSHVADYLSRRHAKRRRPRRPLQGGKFSAGARGGSDDCSALRIRKPSRHAEGAPDDLPRARHAAGARADLGAPNRDRPPPTMPATSLRASKSIVRQGMPQAS